MNPFLLALGAALALLAAAHGVTPFDAILPTGIG